MKITKMSEMHEGWFIGDFIPSVHRTKDFEVAYKKHSKDEIWDKHVHKVAKEINYLIKGQMLINDIKLNPGEIFVIENGEVADPRFLTDCELIVVKVPSVIGDKYNVSR